MASYILIAATNVFDPLGNEYAAGTPGFFFWVGFGVGCMLITFAYVKRIARKAADTTDF